MFAPPEAFTSTLTDRGLLPSFEIILTATQEYVLAYANELEPRIVSQHIELYVNEFTDELGEEGYAAVEALLRRAADAGLTPPLSRPLRPVPR